MPIALHDLYRVQRTEYTIPIIIVIYVHIFSLMTTIAQQQIQIHHGMFVYTGWCFCVFVFLYLFLSFYVFLRSGSGYSRPISPRAMLEDGATLGQWNAAFWVGLYVGRCEWCIGIGISVPLRICPYFRCIADVFSGHQNTQIWYVSDVNWKDFLVAMRSCLVQELEMALRSCNRHEWGWISGSHLIIIMIIRTLMP